MQCNLTRINKSVHRDSRCVFRRFLSASSWRVFRWHLHLCHKMCKKDVFILTLAFFLGQALGDDILGCGGFVKADVDINFSQIEVKQ